MVHERSDPRPLTGSKANAGSGLWQPFPRAQLELGREGERVDLALVLGHDLMGASGFTAALWADYGSALVDWRAREGLKLNTISIRSRDMPR